jgi:hypothetical protein
VGSFKLKRKWFPQWWIFHERGDRRAWWIQSTISLSNKGGHSYSIYVALPDESSAQWMPVCTAVINNYIFKIHVCVFKSSYFMSIISHAKHTNSIPLSWNILLFSASCVFNLARTTQMEVDFKVSELQYYFRYFNKICVLWLGSKYAALENFAILIKTFT